MKRVTQSIWGRAALMGFITFAVLIPRGTFAALSPSITTQPQNLSVVVSSNATFTVVASGQTPLRYQWSFNGANLTNGAHFSGATNTSLTISNVIAGDAGNYRVTVTNSHGSATSSNAALTVLFPPTLTAQPTNQSALVTSNVNFMAAASGTAPLYYQWQKDGTNLSNGGRVSGVSTPALSISGLQTNDGGNYRLFVTNTYGAVTSAVATLTLLMPPSISAQPTSQTVLGGTTATFTIGANGLPAPAFRWQKDGVDLTDGGQVTGAATATLAISGAQTNNAGAYRVVLSNAYGTATSAVATLKVGFALPALSGAVSAWADYDNDGQMDVLLAGVAADGSRFTGLFHNVGGGLFNQVNVSLPQVSVASAAWGDFDNDGNLDFVLTGEKADPSLGLVAVTIVYRNDGHGGFTDIGANIEGQANASVNWVDFDNDGRLDIYLSLFGHFWRNLGNGTFELSPIQTGGAYPGQSDWGDFDNDGDQDLLLSAPIENNGVPPRLLRNDGEAGFSSRFLDSYGYTYATSYTWGDYDNDGFLDILAADYYAQKPVQVFHNNGDGSFTVTNLSAPVFQPILAKWGDYNNDGKLDVLSIAHSPDQDLIEALVNYGTNFNFDLWFSGLSQGTADWVDINNDGALDVFYTGKFSASANFNVSGFLTNYTAGPNTPPTAPTGLNIVLLTNSGVRLQWTPSTDAQTPSPGLNYNLRVGTTPGGVEIMSPASELATGRRQILARGNAGQSNFWLLRNLPAGTYYWSVQAIDTAFAGSMFSSEGNFVITNSRPNISTIPNQTTGADVPPSPIPFVISDNETPADNLQLVGYSSNTNLVPMTGIVFGGSGSNRTVTVTPAPGKAGTSAITVTVLDLQGDDRSSTFALTVTNFPPIITAQPTNQTAIVSSNTTFQVTATGTALAYQWLFNGATLSDDARHAGTATASLSISNVQTTDGGGYSVMVANPVNSITSTAATLTVIVPPSVTIQPKGRSAPLGLPAIFSAAAGGTAPLGYQWTLNGTNLPGATANSYTNLFLTTNDFGAYQMVVTNAGGAATSAVALLTLGPVAAWGNNSFGQALPPPGLSNVVAIAAGSTFSLALKGDGTVAAWGSGMATNVPPNVTNIVAIAAGAGFGLGVRNDGTVAAWGSGVATNVPGSVSNVVGVSGASNHALGLRDEGVLVEWGTGNKTPVPAGLTKVVSVADGVGFGLAAKADGTVVDWGAINPFSVFTPAPPISLSNATSVACGFNHFLVLKSDGTVFARSFTAEANPAITNVPTSLTNAIAISAEGADSAADYSLALRSNGLVVGWGANTAGVTNIPPGLSNVVAIAAGANHSLALVSDGTPVIIREPVGGTAFSSNQFVLNATVRGQAPLTYAWSLNGTNIPNATNASFVIPNAGPGDAGIYQLSVNNPLGQAVSVPVPVPVLDSAPFLLTFPPATNRPFIGGPFTFSAAPGGSGPLQLQWQFNGQDIPGQTNVDLVFSRVHRTNSGIYTLVASNGIGAITSSPALLAPRSVVGWGTSIYGTTNPPVNLSDAIAVALNSEIVEALRADGTVATWAFVGSVVPADVTNVVEIADSGSTCFALRANGTVRGWNVFNVAFSNALANLSSIVSIEADNNGITALRPDGTVARILNSGAITSFPQLTNIVALSKFVDGFAALRSDGTAFTTGIGAVPPVSAVSNVFEIALDRSWGAVLKRDRTIRTWGVFSGQTNISNAIAVCVNAAVRSNGTVAPWIWTPNSPTLTNVPAGLGNVAELEGTGSATLALLVNRDFQPLLLPDALDTSALVVSSHSSPQWFTETNVTHDGTNAVQSAEIGNNTASSMRTWVAGPVTVSFWWKVSSETNHDFLSFSAGGVLITNISGETGWQQCTVTTPPGNQILQWTYSKDGAGGAGQDAAWVDQLVITPIAPAILTQPSSQDVIGGSNATLVVIAMGTPPLSYQWLKGTNPISGINGNAFTLFSVTRTNSGVYSVIVTNVAGSVTSSNAVLTVHVPQFLSAPMLQPDGSILFNSSDADGGSLSPSDLAHLQAQNSSNLMDWVPLPGALVLTNGVIQLQDSSAVDSPIRFYRIVESW